MWVHGFAGGPSRTGRKKWAQNQKTFDIPRENTGGRGYWLMSGDTNE